MVATLREIYGPGVEKLRVDQRVFVTPSNRKVDVTILQSNHHLELTPADTGNYDRVVIQDLLKEVAQSSPVDAAAKRRFKVVVIHESDCLTREAQAALRRTMEKYSRNLRLILVANTTSRIIGPIRSRCLLVRCAAPKDSDVVRVLQQVASKEKINLSSELAKRLAASADGNLRRALLTLETVHAKHHSSNALPADAVLAPPDWEAYISTLATSIVSTQTPGQILTVRQGLYELITHCIPPPLILATLLKELVGKVDDGCKPDLVRWAAFYEHRLAMGSKAIFHLEGFVAKAMVVIYADLNGMALDGDDDF